ncbi:PREDICTED: uncharacterized protein C6orf47 homolog [Chrysochloris asiatica]|uniref:Uncharacterized protein C6orf47 homolog n=1 Tax=Chrysochloris asiatica TaxID=185453 RepID=A0A9B0U8Y3_CHRAS|nr:PREDICTED: uncharacterized protein C6orf47 homolog [Chrysochloris asiatica]
MFLRRLGGWLPRPWSRRKPTKPDMSAPEPRQMDSSPENSGSDWDSAPETMGDVGPSKTRDSGLQKSSRTAPDSSRTPLVAQLGSRRMDSLKLEKAATGTEESGGAIPKLGQDPVNPGGSRRSGVPPEGGLSPPELETPVEKSGRHQKLLGWLRGESGGGTAAPPTYLGSPEERLQISTNLTLHLLELLASALLGLCSRPLRAALDALGLRGPVGLWLHGLLSFLAALHGLHAVLSLLTAHPLHFACLFGLLQALVLAVSLRDPSGDEEATDWGGERLEKEDEEQKGDPGKGL